MSQQKFNDRVGAAARTAREEAAMSRDEVAEALSVASTTIYRFERGQTMPRNPQEFIPAYAAAVGVDSEQLWRQALQIEPDEAIEVIPAGPRVATIALAAVLMFAVGVIIVIFQVDTMVDSEPWAEESLLTWAQAATGSAFLVIGLTVVRRGAWPPVAKWGALAFSLFEAVTRWRLAVVMLTREGPAERSWELDALLVGQAVALWVFLYVLAIYQPARMIQFRVTQHPPRISITVKGEPFSWSKSNRENV